MIRVSGVDLVKDGPRFVELHVVEKRQASRAFFSDKRRIENGFRRVGRVIHHLQRGGADGGNAHVPKEHSETQRPRQKECGAAQKRDHRGKAAFHDRAVRG